MPASPPRHPAVLAAIWMIGALVSFSAMAIAARELRQPPHAVPLFEMLFFRSLIGVIVLSAVLTRYGWRFARTRRLGDELWRNLAHFAGQMGWFFGIASIPLAEVFAIEFTVPVWTAILAALMLRESLTRSRMIAVAFGLVGMLVILQPGFTTIQPAAFAVLFAAVAYALSHIFTRKLAPYDSPLTVVFYMTVVQLPLGLVPTLFQWVTPTPVAWLCLTVIGVAALAANYCMARALSLADAAVVVPMDFLRLPLIAVIALLLYNEQPRGFVFLGALLMLLGNLLNLHTERKRPVPLAA